MKSPAVTAGRLLTFRHQHKRSQQSPVHYKSLLRRLEQKERERVNGDNRANTHTHPPTTGNSLTLGEEVVKLTPR